MMADEIGALMAVLLACIACSSISGRMAKSYGRPVKFWTMIGGFLPIIGIGILLFRGRAKNNWPQKG